MVYVLDILDFGNILPQQFLNNFEIVLYFPFPFVHMLLEFFKACM